MSSLSKKEVNGYALYAFTTSIGVMLPMSYITIFITENLLVSAALMGTTLLIARSIDFIVGLIAGGIVEKSKLKWGKYRSWLVLLKYTVFVGCVLQFVDTSALPIATRMMITILGYCLLHCSMNFTSTAQYGILASMAGTSMDDRNLLAIRSGQWMAAANIIVSAVALPLINILSPYVGNSNGYLIVAAIFAAVFFIGAVILSKTAAPYDPVQREGIPGAPTVSVKDMIDSVVTNKQLLVVILAYTIFYIGLFAFNGLMAYYFMYILGNFLLMSVAMTATTIFGLVASIVGPKIGIKLGKKNAMVIGLLVYGFGSIAIAFLGDLSLIVYIAINCVMALGMYIFAGFGVNYMLDAGEYGLYTTGKDNRSVAMSMMNIPMKIGMALGGAIAGYGLSFIGYRAGMTVTSEFANGFMNILGGLPAVFYFLGAVVMYIGYKISDADAARYATDNAQRMADLVQEK